MHSPTFPAGPDGGLCLLGLDEGQVLPQSGGTARFHGSLLVAPALLPAMEAPRPSRATPGLQGSIRQGDTILPLAKIRFLGNRPDPGVEDRLSLWPHRAFWEKTLAQLANALVWELESGPLDPGSNLVLTLDFGRQPVLTRVFHVGDLWILAGQSNMEGVGLLADAPAPDPRIHHLAMDRRWRLAQEPLHFLAESPDPVHWEGPALEAQALKQARSQALKGCGPGIFFAKEILRASGRPQGLVSCAHGGTTMAQWDPALADRDGHSLYGSLLISLERCGSKASGILWYQGESDTNIPAQPGYRQRMRTLVEDLRHRLGQPELPWIMVQIGREIGRRWQVDQWHRIQETQRCLPAEIPFLDCCAAADLEHDDWIHLSARSQASLGSRMALLARNLVQRPRGLANPQPFKARWAADQVSAAIEVECRNIQGQLASIGRPRGFTLADPEDFTEYPLVYQVRYREDRIILRLTSDDVLGLGVFHGMGTEADINTYDSRGLPLPVFGPLRIEGLPPLSRWFRLWQLSPGLPEAEAALARWPQGPDPSWTWRHFAGWNVVNMQDEWKGQGQSRGWQTLMTLPCDMQLRLSVGGDGPLAVWLGDALVFHDPVGSADLSTPHTLAPTTLSAGQYPVRVLFSNRGGKAFGFYLRAERLDGGYDGTEASLPQPLRKAPAN